MNHSFDWPFGYCFEMHSIDNINELDWLFDSWISSNIYSIGCDCAPLIFEPIKLNCFFRLLAGIYFRIIGYGKCSWTDFLRRESVAIEGKGERSAIKYSGTEEYLNSTMYIVGSKNGNLIQIVWLNACLVERSLDIIWWISISWLMCDILRSIVCFAGGNNELRFFV